MRARPTQLGLREQRGGTERGRPLKERERATDTAGSRRSGRRWWYLSDAMADAAGDVSGAGGESLVSVFFVAILSVIVFPWTLSKLFGEKKEEIFVGMQGRPPVKKRPWIKRNGNFCFVLFWTHACAYLFEGGI